jgi:hypothetical protein
MGERQMLLWGTGREEMWTVDIVVGGGPAQPPGFRRAVGPIRVAAGQLHLTNYESLTMAAQFDDIRLPEPHLQDLVLNLPAGLYSCEIVQLHDPEDDPDDQPGHQGTTSHFVVILTTGRHPEPWSEPAWHEA